MEAHGLRFRRRPGAPLERGGADGGDRYVVINALGQSRPSTVAHPVMGPVPTAGSLRCDIGGLPVLPPPVRHECHRSSAGPDASVPPLARCGGLRARLELPTPLVARPSNDRVNRQGVL